MDLDSSLADLGDGEDTQGAFPLLLIQTLLLLTAFAVLQYLSPCSLDDQAVDDEQGEGIMLGDGPRYPWDGTDRDYKYEEVLQYFSAIFFPF